MKAVKLFLIKVFHLQLKYIMTHMNIDSTYPNQQVDYENLYVLEDTHSPTSHS